MCTIQALSIDELSNFLLQRGASGITRNAQLIYASPILILFIPERIPNIVLGLARGSLIGATAFGAAAVIAQNLPESFCAAVDEAISGILGQTESPLSDAVAGNNR